MSENNNNNSGFSIYSFAKEKVANFFAGVNIDNIIKWGDDNSLPEHLLTYFDTIPEHSATLQFITDMVVGLGFDKDIIDFWTLKKLTLDYIIFGSFALKNKAKYNGKYEIEWLDMSKCRLTKDEKYIVFHKRNLKTNMLEKTPYALIKNVKETGVFYFKNPLAREYYGRPNYLSAIRVLDTMNNLVIYNQNQAINQFSPEVVLNVPEEPTPDRMLDFERKFKQKFTNNGQRFMVYFNQNPNNKVTVDTIDREMFDESFDVLYKTLRNQIIISHRLTSIKLLGGPDEGSGFSKTEFEECFDVFKRVVTDAYRAELIYAFSSFFGEKEIKIVDNNTNNQSPVNNDNNIQ